MDQYGNIHYQPMIWNPAIFQVVCNSCNVWISSVLGQRTAEIPAGTVRCWQPLGAVRLWTLASGPMGLETWPKKRRVFDSDGIHDVTKIFLMLLIDVDCNVYTVIYI